MNKPSTLTLVFSTAERRAFEKRQRRDEEFLLSVANLSAEERERRCAQRLKTQLARGRGMIRMARARQAGKIGRRVARPTRPARTNRIGRTSRTIVQSSAPSRGDPDDDPDHEPLTGRGAELAEQLQRATDEKLAQWRAERIAREAASTGGDSHRQHTQLRLGDAR